MIHRQINNRLTKLANIKPTNKRNTMNLDEFISGIENTIIIPCHYGTYRIDSLNYYIDFEFNLMFSTDFIGNNRKHEYTIIGKIEVLNSEFKKVFISEKESEKIKIELKKRIIFK